MPHAVERTREGVYALINLEEADALLLLHALADCSGHAAGAAALVLAAGPGDTVRVSLRRIKLRCVACASARGARGAGCGATALRGAGPR